MNNLKQEAERLLSIPCGGYVINSTSGYDTDCEYDTDIICEECVCNFWNYPDSQLFYDPVSNKPISKKVLNYMRKILKEEIQ